MGSKLQSPYSLNCYITEPVLTALYVWCLYSVLRIHTISVSALNLYTLCTLRLNELNLFSMLCWAALAQLGHWIHCTLSIAQPVSVTHTGALAPNFTHSRTHMAMCIKYFLFFQPHPTSSAVDNDKIGSTANSCC